MKLVLIRHAQAEERALLGREYDRRLTPDGRRRMRVAAQGIRVLIPEITFLAASPLVRAQQTADIVAEQYRGLDVTPVDALAPGQPPRAVLAWLKQQPMDATVAAVGHEPDLGIFASHLLARRTQSFLPFKKGAACLIEFVGEPATGQGLLVWMLTPSILRRIGR